MSETLALAAAVHECHCCHACHNASRDIGVQVVVRWGPSAQGVHRVLLLLWKICGVYIQLQARLLVQLQQPCRQAAGGC